MWMHFISRGKICGFYLAKTWIIAWSNWICWIFLLNAHDDIISFLSFSGWLLGCYRPVVCVLIDELSRNTLRQKKDLRQKKNLRQTKNKTKKELNKKRKKELNKKRKKVLKIKDKKELKKRQKKSWTKRQKREELYKKQRRIKLCTKKSLFYQRCCLFSLCASSECLCVLLEKVERK